MRFVHTVRRWWEQANKDKINGEQSPESKGKRASSILYKRNSRWQLFGVRY